MKFKKVNVQARREYFLTLVRKNGERETYYLPYVFNTEAEARAVADKKNAYYNHGRLIVEYVDRPASVAYETTLHL